MSLRRKWRMKMKTKGGAEDHYHFMFNNVLTSNSDLLQSNTQERCCVLDTMDYNYKLRSVIRREDDSKLIKLIWFNKQVRDTFWCSWMISRKLVDHTNIGRAIGHILDMIYAPSVSMRDSIGSATSFFHTSMVVHPRSNDHLRIHEFIYEGLLSSLSKEH